MSGEDVEKIVDGFLKLTPSQIAKLKEVLAVK
jgi:hypothetical protein